MLQFPCPLPVTPPSIQSSNQGDLYIFCEAWRYGTETPPLHPWLAASRGDFLPRGQLTVQARIANGNTMKLDLKKLAVIITVIIIFIPKNLGRKEGRD